MTAALLSRLTDLRHSSWIQQIASGLSRFRGLRQTAKFDRHGKVYAGSGLRIRKRFAQIELGDGVKFGHGVGIGAAGRGPSDLAVLRIGAHTIIGDRTHINCQTAISIGTHCAISFFLPLQVFQKLQNLRLNRDIQRGRGFIRHQHPRTPGQGHRQHGALLHPAGKLMRITGKHPRRLREANLTHKLHQTLLRVAALLRRQDLVDLIANSEHRIQTLTGVLKNIGKAPPRPRFHTRRPPNLAFILNHPARKQPPQRRRRNALAAAAFAHQRRGLSRAQRQMNPANNIIAPRRIREKANP